MAAEPEIGQLRQVCPHCGTRFERPLDPAFCKPAPHTVPRRAHYSETIQVGDPETVHLGDPDLPLARVLDSELRAIVGKLVAALVGYQCPKCALYTFDVHVGQQRSDDPFAAFSLPKTGEVYVAHPQGAVRPVSEHVPVEIASDFREATRIAHLSRKGASTLARRCLQATLRAAYPGLPKGKDLFDEIQWVVENDALLPDELGGALHALRKAGNFGAHPARDGLTPIYELDPGQLNACFDMLEWLFEEKFVRQGERKAHAERLRTMMFPPPSPDD